MHLPEDEFELWLNRAWVPIHKSELRRGDVFRSRWFRNANGEAAVMRLVAAPERDAEGNLVFDVRLEKQWKQKKQ